MLEAASDPALMATDLAEWLVKRNVPFRLAHHRVGKFVGYCRQHNIPLDKCSFEQLKSCIPEADVSSLFSCTFYVLIKIHCLGELFGTLGSPEKRFLERYFWRNST
jgi:argininosuccinate lyase